MTVGVAVTKVMEVVTVITGIGETTMLTMVADMTIIVADKEAIVMTIATVEEEEAIGIVAEVEDQQNTQPKN